MTKKPPIPAKSVVNTALSATNSQKPALTKSRGLGLGVDALFFNDKVDTLSHKDTVVELAITAIVPGRYQPRKSFDDEAANDLTQSVREFGVLQPILVRRNPDSNNYELIAGERRWRAAKAADKNTIPAIVREYSEQQIALIGLVENLQREDLNCLEEAEGIEKVLHEHKLTHEKVAALLGKSRSSITNALRLLELSPPIKEYLRQGLLEMGHARALLTLNPPSQKIVADTTIDEGLSVRDVEKLAKSYMHPSTINTKKQGLSTDNILANPPIDNEIEPFIQQIREKMGLQITYNVDKKGKGFLKIDFSKKEQFTALLTSLNKLGYPQ